MSQLARFFVGPLRQARCRACGAALAVDEARWAWVSLPFYALVLYGIIVAGIIGDSIAWGLVVIGPAFLLSLLLTRFVPLRLSEDDPERNT